MGETKNSLTEWPENLKEIIDWFLRVGGKDKGSLGYGKGKELQKAVEALGGFSKEASGLGNFHLEGLFGYVTNGLMEFIGYDGAWTVTGKGIGRNGNSPYTSSYGDQAQWNGDLNKPGTTNANKAALIFLGTMPIVYLVMSYIYWRCSSRLNGHWKDSFLSGVNGVYLYRFLSAMGYSSDKLNININGEIVMTNVAEKLDELSKTSDSASPKDYRAFLQKLEENAPTLPINHPLCSLHILATKYFNSQSQLAPAKQIIKTINRFKEKLIEHSIREESSYFSSSDSGDYDDLKEPIINLLSQVAQFKPDDTHNKLGEGVNQAAGQAGKEGEKIGRGVHHGANQGGASSAQPSPAGPVAGAVTTLSLGGGAAAAYLFNIGGAKTLVNGILRIG